MTQRRKRKPVTRAPARPGPVPQTPPSSAPAKRPLAKIRHDLRTPINHIIGFSEMLLEEARGQAPEDFLRDLQKIRSGGDRLLALIQQHLAEETFAEQPDLGRLCHDLRTPVNHIIGYSELLTDRCDDLSQPTFKADLARINDAAKTWLALMEEHLLGQTASEGVLRQPPGQAQTEIFRRMDKAFAQPPAETQSQALTEQGHLLLADDDEPNRELICRRLRKLGYEVTAVADGAAALEKAATGRFDLVLLDLLMPGLDGRDVLARMKSDLALRHVPVIMISALDQVAGIVHCIELGAEDYVAKPFNPVFLRARIGAALEKKRLRDREVSYLRQIQREKQRSDELLNIILPRDVAEELKTTSAVQPRRFEQVGVLFCDIVGFTRYCDQHRPEDVLTHLQGVVEAFEELAARQGMEKIKTIGDSFMGTAGLRAPVENPALMCVQCGLKMIAAARRLPPHWEVRVGVHVGPVMAGVVGRSKYLYDVWGDTVNLAARMEQAAEPGSICVTSETWGLLEGRYPGRPRGRIEIKGKGPLDLFCL